MKSINETSTTHFPYDLRSPIKSYSLPNQYKEISGISPLETNDSLAFVQDEAVQIHTFNLTSERVIEHNKHEAGDSEDITIAGNTAYLLKAGNHPAIYKVTDFTCENAHYERYDLDLHKDQDPEGLCHDVKRNRLLIACKGSIKNKDRTRGIYAFSLQFMQIDHSPVLTIDSQDFLPNSEETFNPSGIVIHPQSDVLYIIGSKGVKMIACYELDGYCKGAWRLNENQFIQPEGIALMPSGELVISSEGKKGKKAKILVFSNRQ
ncbi:hypothetical protein SynSYN20_03189 [Synechococcus sp. SYN20]|uniref:SdiA-regulated domain-containing protein n=1 Tax=Synechococcus sp. SYN20 TaxID=1050714 RepID=UPI00164923DF|nr:SdiA-regulated domain-containing protein [Synechococcus sp. SYN20]QNJ27481.1 hypothetical protein SynSYN20_03189 [Synechococcus sp. SYN20]